MIDVRGLSCPEPLIKLKKALMSQEKEYEIVVDNPESVENITRYALHNGYHVKKEIKDTDCYLKIFKD